MYKQIVAVLALVAASHAGVISTGLGLASPLALSAAPAIALAHNPQPVDIHPQYSYSYGVHDPHTGDIKGQTETRDGDVVRGQYSLVDSDGTRRVVDYAADRLNGFNAIVRKEPLAVVTKTVAAAPVIAASAPALVKTVAAPALVNTVAYPGLTTLGAHSGSISVQDISGRILLGSSPLALNGLNLGYASVY